MRVQRGLLATAVLGMSFLLGACAGSADDSAAAATDEQSAAESAALGVKRVSSGEERPEGRDRREQRERRRPVRGSEPVEPDRDFERLMYCRSIGWTGSACRFHSDTVRCIARQGCFERDDED
jgi:hypothetical protein